MISAKESLTGKLNSGIIHEYPELENLEITPSMEEQHFKSEKYGYNNVIVNAIESKELNVTPNVTEQVKEGIFNKVTVAGDSNLIPENIKNGVEIFGVQGNAKVSDVKITNASYLFYNGYRLDYLNEILSVCENTTQAMNMFANCSYLTDLDLSNFNTTNVTIMDSMFSGCSSLVNLDLSNFNTSKLTNMTFMFYGCKNLVDLNLSSFDVINVVSVDYMFYNCKNLTNLKSFKNLGKGYTKKTNNYNKYKLDLSYSTLLTYDSLMSVINNLYDLNLAYNVAGGGKLYTQALVLGATNLAKLTAEEIEIATAKRLDCIVKEEKKMLYFSYTKPKMIVAENGKQIRQKDDIYKEAYIDENGQEVPEHLPYYSTTIFVPDSFTEEEMNELYVEEDID